MSILGLRAPAPCSSPAQIPRGTGKPCRVARHLTAKSTMIDASIFPVSLFPSNKIILPTVTGNLRVFEHHFLQMFEDLATKAGGHNLETNIVRFGHILDPSVAPPAFLADNLAGMPRVGVLATVKRITRNEDGSLLVQYEGMKRIKLINVWQFKPYMIAAASYMTDRISVGGSEELVDALECDVYDQIKEVGRLSKKLQTSDESPTGLPDSIPRYAPPPRPSRPRTIADQLTEAGHPAGTAINMWHRHGSVYGNNVKQDSAPAQDPYAYLSEKLGKDTRQELFSFAAANMLELGPAESLALLTTTDRVARLQFVAAAVAPFLQEQRAKASLARVLGSGSGNDTVTGP